MKARADSLYARLSSERREELLFDLVEGGKSLAQALERLAGWKVKTSAASLSRFLSSHGFAWRLERAKAAAQATEKALPADWDAQKKRMLAQKMFEAICAGSTSRKELVSLKRVELAEEKIRLESRRVAILEKQIAATREVITNPKLSPEEQRKRLKEIFA